ncbi:MAG: protein kinase [Steroidobacteraceae bacterium]
MGDKKMIDPTQTQPLPWREDQAPGKPWEGRPVEPPNRQPGSGGSSPPDRLADRGYRLRARIGSGRLGAIYEAQDDLSRSSGSQHFVAIQLIDDKIVSRPSFAADFERGAVELQTISHPNIVKLLEYGRDANRFYLVMELLESASLRFVLSDVTELPLEETAAVVRAAGDALQYLHAKSIVHGNLKPENVLVTFGYEVKLLDIVPTDWLDNPDDDLGVPARKPDKRDDVFGLACLAYEMLAGRHPFNGNTAQEAYRAGLEPAPIATISARQWRALAGALAVHRDDRTPSVAQFLDEFGVTGIERLRTVVSAGEEPQPAYDPAAYAPPPLLGERVVPYGPRRSGTFGRVLLLLAVLGIGALAYIYQDRLREQAESVMAAIDAKLQGDSTTAAGTRPAEPAADDVMGTDAPLPQVATVTDPDPAMVLAPGATAPPATAPPSAPAPTTAAPTAAPTNAAPNVAAPAPTPAPTITTVDAGPPAVAPAAEAPARTPGVTRFSFAQPVVTVRENEVAARILIRRSGDASGAATIAWWTGDDTAIADEDYIDLGARVERFEPGETSRTVFIPLIKDTVTGPTKSFNVYLGRGEAGRSGESPLSGMRVDIIDDD